jgi:hypothetical protein
MARVALSAGEEVETRFALPVGGEILHTTARVVWAALHSWGVKFSYVPEDERLVPGTGDDGKRRALVGGAVREDAGGVRVTKGVRLPVDGDKVELQVQGGYLDIKS